MFQYISCYSLSDTTPSPVPGKCLFQYISCYSLSKYDCWIARYPAGFQYISCYSLSGRATVWKHINQCFNTSHVTLYPLSVKALKTLSKCFNTSHVTLYPKCHQSQKTYILFQYISCYSLSLVFPIFSLLTFFIISQNTRVCNIFPKQHRLFESFHRSTPKPYIFTTFHIFL